MWQTIMGNNFLDIRNLLICEKVTLFVYLLMQENKQNSVLQINI